MYEVMARRYRPARFDEVVGQEHIALTLRNAISRDRVAHAYIFTGGHGCGKTTMARILAKALVCVNGPTPDPCGVCPLCLDVAAGRDSDVLEIDGASNNGIEQIRLLREQAVYVPTRARYKIYTIDEVHMLSDGAFNALLKTLEEPPKHVKFILATTDPHKVPDTILSRCQRFDFRLVPQPKLVGLFRKLAADEGAAIAPDALDAVSAFAEGSVRDGLVLLDQLLSFADGEVTRADVESVRGVAPAENVAGIYESIARADVRAALALVDEVANRGINVGDFLDQLVSFGRDLMLLAATGGLEGASAYGPARESLEKLGRETALESALLYLDVFTQARTRVRSRALSNPLVVLEMAVARLAGLAGVTPVSEIVSRLEGLPLDADKPRHRDSPVFAPAAPPAPPPAPPPEHQPPPQPVEEQRPADRPEPAPAPAHTPPWEPDAPEKMPVRNGDGGENASEGAETESVPVKYPPFDMEIVTALWDKVIDTLAQRHPADLRHISRVVLTGVDPDAVKLSGPPTAIEAMQDARRLTRLSEAAEETLGRPVAFEFTESAPKRRDDAAAGEMGEAQKRMVRHPAVTRIKDLFNGVVVDCQPNESHFDAPSDDELPPPGEDGEAGAVEADEDLLRR